MKAQFGVLSNSRHSSSPALSIPGPCTGAGAPCTSVVAIGDGAIGEEGGKHQVHLLLHILIRTQTSPPNSPIPIIPPKNS